MQENKTTKTIDLICRLFVGLVFIMSGFVKGVDPLGTSFKIQEYMTAWSIGGITFEWALPFATFLAMALVTVEFTIGVMLIFNAHRKLYSWLLLLMMVFFTATTLADAITNKVTDCGCFGDFIKLSNWQTFWKNIVLLLPTVYIFLCRRWNEPRRFERNSLITIFAIVAMVIFGLYNIGNEPCIDFRPWKVGNRMIAATADNMEVKSYLSYRNTATGEVEEFESAKLMDYYSDSLWMATHEFVDSRVEDPYEIEADGFSMLGPDDQDYAKELIASQEYVLIATIHHLDKVSDDGTKALALVNKFANENNINLVLLTCALPEETEAYLMGNNLDAIPYYFADATAIETMMRSNPGFILLKDATVMGKWHYRNINKMINNYNFAIE